MDWVLARLGAIRLWPRLGVGSSGWPEVGSCWKLLWRVGGSFERRRVGLEGTWWHHFGVHLVCTGSTYPHHSVATHCMARLWGVGLWWWQCTKEEEAQLMLQVELHVATRVFTFPASNSIPNKWMGNNM